MLNRKIETFLGCDNEYNESNLVIFEASLLNKPLFFYAFDYEEYMRKRSMYIDYIHDLPGTIFQSPKSLIDSLNYPQRYDIQSFTHMMIAKPQTTYQQDIVRFLMEQWK